MQQNRHNRYRDSLTCVKFSVRIQFNETNSSWNANQVLCSYGTIFKHSKTKGWQQVAQGISLNLPAKQSFRIEGLDYVKIEMLMKTLTGAMGASFA